METEAAINIAPLLWSSYMHNHKHAMWHIQYRVQLSCACAIAIEEVVGEVHLELAESDKKQSADHAHRDLQDKVFSSHGRAKGHSFKQFWQPSQNFSIAGSFV